MRKILFVVLLILALVPGAAKASHEPRVCSTFVCATAVATGATVICDTSSITPLVHVLTCQGVVALGGHGDTTGGLLALPGVMSWNGFASCAGDCSSAQAAASTSSWSGFGNDGNGSNRVIQFPQVQKYDYNPFCCQTCIDYSVFGNVNVDAYATLLGIAVDHASSSDSDSAGRHWCY